MIGMTPALCRNTSMGTGAKLCKSKARPMQQQEHGRQKEKEIRKERERAEKRKRNKKSKKRKNKKRRKKRSKRRGRETEKKRNIKRKTKKKKTKMRKKEVDQMLKLSEGRSIVSFHVFEKALSSCRFFEIGRS